MVWKYNPDTHVTFDPDCGLFLAKEGHQRDNFRFSIRRNTDDQLFVQFQAQPLHNRTTPVTRIGGILEYTLTWKVAAMDATPDQKDTICSALLAYSNPQRGGFAKFADGEGLRAKIRVDYVDSLQGY